MTMKRFFSVLWKLWKGLCTLLFSFFGICGWLLKALLTTVTVACLIALCVGAAIFIKVKPEVDHCREVAYDKLATMDRSDFSKLSDTIIYDKDGKQIGLINAGHYKYVDIDHISMNVQNAYIAQEDRRFKSHTGVDWIATLRAGLALVKHGGAITQGGSTITQQVIKNTYLTQEQTFTRKVVEILLAPEVEKKFSKADIMEFYCNTNFYGHQCNGIQAASRYYFGKDASELEPHEAAVLVGISNSPSAYDPVKRPEASLKKRNDVLKSMEEVGYLTREEYETYTGLPLNIVQETMEGTDESYQTSYAIHCAALELMRIDNFPFRYLFQDKADFDAYQEQYSEIYGQKNDDIRAGGYKIYTSLDEDQQNALQEAIDLGLSSFTELQDSGKFALQGAAVIVDNRSNYVTAIVGGRGTEDQFNRAYLSARQPGSTIKPLIDYGPAFDTGEYYPSRMVDDHKWEDGPSNSGGSYFGSVTIREALNRSLNTVAWQVLEDIGVHTGLNYLSEMEFQKLSFIDNSGIPSLSIGGFTNGVRVVDMAKGFSTLANYGVYNDRTCIQKIVHEQKGELTKNHRPSTKQVYLEDSAYMLTDILKGTMTSPYGTGRGLSLADGMPCAGKTGTTNSSKDTWFCGYTRYYTTAVWVGYDTPRAMPGVYGSTYAGKIWKNVMNTIHEGLEPLDWETPVTVEKRTDPDNGITDYFSTTSQLRAIQAEHEKDQKARLAELKSTLAEFEKKEINSAADGYWVRETYQNMILKLSVMDENEERQKLLERIEARYETFQPELSARGPAIEAYARQKAAEEEAARQRAAAEEAARQQQEAAAQAAAAEASRAAEEAARQTQPETEPDYSAGPGAFPSESAPPSSHVTIIPQGPGGNN
ncbi:MAG: transglycosylase domain-containing protein [Lachnospiraceae bacterium]|nr:transglycosylase domain-containing protein [Lachnospiraceae bacterium]